MIIIYLVILIIIFWWAYKRSKQQNKNRKIVSTPIAVLGIIFLGIPILLVIITLLTPEGRKEIIKSQRQHELQQKQKVKPSLPDKIEAYVMAQSFVEKRLKTPRTAKFPWHSDGQIINTGNRYKVSSYVDSQNTFGAMIRTYYTVIMEYQGNNKWKLIDINFKQ